MDNQSQMHGQQMFSYDERTLRKGCVADFSFLLPLRPTVVFETYWRFAAERQAIFFRRLRGDPPPWTTDPILQLHKFTNAYRASDRVSQYLIKHVIYEGEDDPEEVIFRTLLFKFFNRIDTWTRLREAIGDLKWSNFKIDTYDRKLLALIDSGERIYSPAYIMPSGGPKCPHKRKHQMHLHLLERMMKEGLPGQISKSTSMNGVFELLRSFPSIGNFLAFQFATDINYSNVTSFDEMRFVVPGPGAVNGIRKCFESLGGKTETQAIEIVAEHQQECFEALGIEFQPLWGRKLQLVDCQNLFCEVDKYARVKHPEFSGVTKRVRIKQKFESSGENISYWYPPKWKLNDLISKEVGNV